MFIIIFLECKFSHTEEITFIVLILSPGKCYLILLLHRDIEILVETTWLLQSSLFDKNEQNHESRLCYTIFI